MNVLILGSGGREHALAWKISQSSSCTNLYIAPGNGGTKECGENVSINLKDFKAIGVFVSEKKIDFVVVGPEEPLVQGIVDYFQNDPSLKNIRILGPSAAGAKLEGSKDYAKAFMARHKIPTASYKSFTKDSQGDARSFLESLKPPYVLKADGLAAGKGVLISESIEEAGQNVINMLEHSKFGTAGSKIVIEEFLRGIELSVFVLTDGSSYKILPEAKDYKRIGDNDSGPNTGGMGAVSPVPFAGKDFMRKVEDNIIKPTIDALRNENIFYRGFIFIGLMNVDGNPYVIEYNVRMGDPETEVVFPRITSNVLELLYNAADGRLDEATLDVDPRTAVTIMAVSGGYPESYQSGKPISMDKRYDSSIIFHAGTAWDKGKLVTNGGRVLSVTSFGNTIEEAGENAYRQLGAIDFENKFWRKDIGRDLVNLQATS